MNQWAARNRAATRGTCAALLLAALGSARCGGKSESRQIAGGSGQSGALGRGGSSDDQGGSATTMGGSSGGGAPTAGSASGGQASHGGNTIVPVGGRGGETSSGGTSDSGAAGSGNSCDTKVLWDAILQGALGGLGTCEAADVPGSGEIVSRRRGAVVIDSSGKAIDNTGLSGAEKEAWLEMWAAERWVCIAGQSIGYKCKPAS